MSSKWVNVVVLLAVSATGMGAQADMVGVYSLTDDKQKDAGTMTIQYRDEQRVRYDFNGRKADESGALLLLNDKLYAITPQGEVMDMALVAGIAGALGATHVKPKAQPTFSLDATGKKESVAGVTGEVYTWGDGAHSGEVVLSKDPRAKQLSQAMERVGDHMQQSMGNSQVSSTFREMRDHPVLRDKGIVRSQEASGSSMRLEEITESPLADALFVLPKKVNATALPGMPNGIPNMNDPQIQMLMKELMKSQGH
ncbi:MAG: hypothetical protein B7Y40_08955 [Gammaproteobacteria bacterium 28-57-27]|nr:MAG: hypothetical protein B7Y40_08955 [Gammaproteobacteria bacterium 28-57-27]